MAAKFDLHALKAKQPLILGAVIGLLLLFVDMQWVLAKWVQMLRASQPKVTKLRQEIKQAAFDAQQHPAMEQRLTELRAQYSRHSQQLLSEAEMPQLYKQLGELAKQSNVKIVSISRKDDTGKRQAKPAGRGESGFLTVIPIAIQARAGYYALVQFLEQLERSGLLINVSDVSIKADSQSATQQAVQLTLSMYALREGVAK
ncbi:MAG: type 4a pilus biogenesis protein PilO [Candidatus Omnitrophica bacterium]|nr:type 4a pilus biogenesis protein PilO [Candidatus Omnitrophota bacterium]